VFARATLPVPEAPSHFYLDARKGLHTEHLGLLLAQMQSLPRAYPDAVW
jgi:ring-1,2-phenylacetyl-CoA epoxidase subunit PaaC